MNPKTTKPLDIYIRVSQRNGRGGDSFQSPQQQEDRCRAQLKADGLKVGKVFTDIEQSDSKASRPAFDEALRRVGSGESGGIIVHDLSRFGRSTRNVLDGIDFLRSHGAAFVSCAEKIDTDTSTGRFFLTIIAALRQLELEQSKERWAVSQSNAVKRGLHISAKTPFGYERNGEGRYAIDPKTAPLVKELFKRRGQGASWPQLARYLDESGVPPANSERWPAGTVRTIVRNRVYLGESRGGQGYVNDKAHDPIVSLEEWERANRRKQQSPAIRKGEGRILQGLCYCASCGGRMTADTTRKDGMFFPIYRCRRRIKGGAACEQPATISATKLEMYVLNELLANAEIDGVRVGKNQSEERQQAQEVLNLADNEIRELDRSLAEEDISPSAYAKALTKAEQARSEALDRLAQLPPDDAAAFHPRLAEIARQLTEGVGWGWFLTHGGFKPSQVREVLTGLCGLERVVVKRGRLPVEERVEIVRSA